MESLEVIELPGLVQFQDEDYTPLHFNQLPGEVIVHIFKFLPLHVVKILRLVCRMWYSLCEDRIITDTEKFVFRYKNSKLEINDFLINLNRTRVNLEFVNVKLEELNFNQFGEKVKKLQITNCYIDDEEILMKILCHTPNMEHLDLRLDSNFDFCVQRGVPMKVMAFCQQRRYENHKLAIFEHRGTSREPLFPTSELIKIFPRLRSIRLDELELMRIAFNETLKEVYNCSINFDDLDDSESFLYLSKLSTLDLNASLCLKNHASIALCLKLFDQQTELESLVVRFAHTKGIECVNDFEDTTIVPKKLLLHILKRCRKLKKLMFFMTSDFPPWNDVDDDMLEILSFVKSSTILRLNIPFDYYNIFKSSNPLNAIVDPTKNPEAFFRQKVGVLKEIHCSLNDCSYIDTVLHLHKYLFRVKVEVNRCIMPINPLLVPSIAANRRHARLKHFELVFIHEITPIFALDSIKHFSVWDFPNLSTITLHCELACSKNKYSEFRSVLLEWLETLTSLKEIDIQFSCLDITDCARLCESLTELQQITWANADLPDSEVIISLFTTCPNLRFVTINVASASKYFRHYYCRSTNELYRCTVANWEASTPYELVTCNDNGELPVKLVAETTADVISKCTAVNQKKTRTWAITIPIFSIFQKLFIGIPLLTNFTETLRTLGYRRMVSLESFRQPNFPLTADILLWLVKRFDADYNVSSDCATSELRVLLIRSVTEFMVLKTGLKLNMKKLYMADGHAVKEMLKITALLLEALKIQQTTDDSFSSFANIDLSAKIQELKLTRELALQITRKGSSLFELLAKEPTLRECRTSQANTYVDVSEVETLIQKVIEDTSKNIVQVEQQIENISSTESNLDSKIGKKENDLERVSKRLETLKGVRPAFLEEYERYEDELNQTYDSYVIKFRCYAYLQQQLQQILSFNQAAAVNVDANERDDTLDKMSSLVDDGSLSSSSPTPAPPPSKKPNDTGLSSKRPHISRIRTAKDPRKSSTHMYGGVKDDSDDLDDDEDDDDDEDELLDGNSLIDNNDSDDDDSELQASEAGKFKLTDDKSDDTF